MKIGKVTVLRELGAGAGSKVFLVRREKDGQEYALKVAAVGSDRTRKYLAQAENEFRIAGLFDHPNLIRIHCLETDAGWFSGPKNVRLLAEYAPGQTMDLLPLQPVPRLLSAFEQVASAMAHMHEQGIVHADLKPNNLILAPTGTVKVIDFGVAQRIGEQKDRLRVTPEFMAPETVTTRLLNEKTDIYSLGATMYRVATLRFPPSTRNAAVLGERGFEREYQEVAALNPQVPPELSDLIRACLRFDPKRRPESMDELRKGLGSIEGSQEAGTRR
jgi:serine/threonine protein kinase